jgi:hypothetical protein
MYAAINEVIRGKKEIKGFVHSQAIYLQYTHVF